MFPLSALWPRSLRRRITLLLILGLSPLLYFAPHLPFGLSLLILLSWTILVLESAFGRRIESLQQLVRRSTSESGRLEPRSFGGPDELSRLGRAILEMASQLRDTSLKADDRSRQLDELFSAMGEGVALVHLSGKIIKANNTLRRWTGWYGPVEGRQITDVIKSLDLSKALRDVRIALGLSGSDASMRSRYKDRATEQSLRDFEPLVIDSMHVEGPEAKRVKVKLLPIKDALRQDIVVLVYLLDVTELHQSELLRREFFANVTHELKTPIAAIRGYAEVLKDMRGGLDPEQVEQFLAVIERNALDLTKLIDEMVTITKLESGALSLDIRPYDLRQALERVFETCLPKARQAQVELLADISEDAAIINVDAKRFDSVLLNLVDNAVKYNRPGGYVRVSSRKAKDAIHIFVEDTGLGIPSGAATRVFERFFRVDKSHARLGGGTGLGLAITKHVVIAHGGQISVRSEVEAGTVFKISLPVASPTQRMSIRSSAPL